MIGSGNNKDSEEWFFDRMDTTYLMFLILPYTHLFSVGSIWFSMHSNVYWHECISKFLLLLRKKGSCKLQKHSCIKKHACLISFPLMVFLSLNIDLNLWQQKYSIHTLVILEACDIGA